MATFISLNHYDLVELALQRLQRIVILKAK